MLTPYLNAALARAKIEQDPEDKLFYGEVPGFEGVFADGPTFEACRDELERVLEEWVLIQLQMDFPLPDVGVRTT